MKIVLNNLKIITQKSMIKKERNKEIKKERKKERKRDKSNKGKQND